MTVATHDCPDPFSVDLPEEFSELLKRHNDAAMTFFLIENVLRGIIIEGMERAYGPRWWEQRMPPNLKSIALVRLNADRGPDPLNAPICHVACYLDFPDLRQIIVKRDNWRDCFQPLFQQPQYVDSEIGQLDGPRNRVAHGRLVSQYDAVRIASAWAFLQHHLGGCGLADLIHRATAGSFPSQELAQLWRALAEASQAATECRPHAWPGELSEVTEAWWFSNEVLGMDCDAVLEACAILEEYCGMPRYAGMGPDVTRWVSEVGLEDRVREAGAQILSVVGEMQ